MKSKASTEITFLGVKTLGITSPVQLSMKTGADIVVAHLEENETYDELIFSDPINSDFTHDIQKNTQIIFDYFSYIIIQKPEKYFWIHNRFKPYN